MGGMTPAPASAGDLLMPTLAPIHPAAYPPAAAASRIPAGGPPVPIFALNAKGSYYVPMSVELAVIAPFMALYTEETYSVLHPVTISVNFQVRTAYICILVGRYRTTNRWVKSASRGC